MTKDKYICRCTDDDHYTLLSRAGILTMIDDEVLGVGGIEGLRLGVVMLACGSATNCVHFIVLHVNK